MFQRNILLPSSGSENKHSKPCVENVAQTQVCKEVQREPIEALKRAIFAKLGRWMKVGGKVTEVTSRRYRYPWKGTAAVAIAVGMEGGSSYAAFLQTSPISPLCTY
jgi:hypothetical protein